MPPNYYYDLEDMVEGKVKGGAQWTYSSLRPPLILGYSLGSTMNIVTCIAVYGTICRELGIDMRSGSNLCLFEPYRGQHYASYEHGHMHCSLWHSLSRWL